MSSCRLAERLEPGQFALAAGADPKWVRNAAAVLGERIVYDVTTARRLGLARELHVELQLPLARADALAAGALAKGSAPLARPGVAARPASVAQIVVDVPRYLSTFAARLSLARTWGTQKRRGRRPRHQRDPLAAARAHGVDLTLILSSLGLTPAERLRRLDQNAAFLASMRRVGPKRRT